MDWLMVSVATTSAGIEPVCGALYDAGITGLEIEDEADFLDFLENNHQYWDYVDDDLREAKKGETCVKAYVSDNVNGRDMLLSIRTAVAALKARDEEKLFGRLEITLANMHEEDWANNWKQYYKPLEIGPRLLVCPEWEEPGETERTVLTMNPGMSFGTGTHHSTRMCLEALQELDTVGDAVLDLGCGSGILSIAALLFGAQTAMAVDIDPNAARIAAENAAKNGFHSDRFHSLAGDLLSDGALRNTIGTQKYDVVFANIVADVIIPLAPFVPALMKPGGVFITSGIIDTRLDEVTAALDEAGFSTYSIREADCWRCAVCKR